MVALHRAEMRMIRSTYDVKVSNTKVYVQCVKTGAMSRWYDYRK